MQGIQDFIRLLQGVAFGIIELFGPFLRIFEPMMKRPVGWTVHVMVRMSAGGRVLHEHFGPRLGRRLASHSRAPHHCNKSHRPEYFGFHLLACPWKGRTQCARLAEIRVQDD